MSTATQTSVCVCGLLREAVVANGGKPEDLDLLSQQGVAEGVAKTIATFVALLRDVYVVTVDYNQPLDQMVTGCDCNFNNPNITATNFSISGQDTVDEDIILLHLGYDIESETAIEEMKKLGLEPAKLEHALAFGKKYPDKQREFPIVFLGSSCVVAGDRYVTCLHEYSAERHLRLYFFGSVWGGRCRFAAVRLPAKATP